MTTSSPPATSIRCDPAYDGRGRLLARFTARWLVPLVIGAVVLPVVLVLEGVGLVTSPDRRSTTSRLLDLRVRTREEWAALRR